MPDDKLIIGIIGGAGVKAGVELMRRIEDKVTGMGAYRDGHHPEIILWQATSAPSRSMFLEGRGPSFVGPYVEVARKLKKCGAKILCMSCNTAHAAIRQVERAAGIPFIDLLKETALTLRADFPGKYRVGLLCSQGTADHRLYDACFAKHHPKAVAVYPDQRFQALVNRGICEVKNTSDMSPANKTFRKAVRHLMGKKTDVIVIACTDISLALGAKDFESDFLDTTDVLADSIIRFWLANANPLFLARRRKHGRGTYRRQGVNAS